MNTITITTDDIVEEILIKPGAKLAAARLQLGYTPEYIAGKLHLRVKIIELLESDDYENMPEEVFIKGYLRSYAKLVGLQPQPLLDVFNASYVSTQRKTEKALWQSRRETNRAEHAIRWLTGIFALVVVTAVAIWWYANKGNETLFSTNDQRSEISTSKSETEIRLTDLSKMRSLLSSPRQPETLEREGG
jgi:cytoskeleton protein RodZ